MRLPTQIALLTSALLLICACGVPPNATTHYSAAGISFDYPSAWTKYEPNHPGHYASVLAYLGTGTATQSCAPDYIPGSGACAESFDLPPGSTILRVSALDGPPQAPGGRIEAILQSDKTAVARSISGAAAVVQTTRSAIPNANATVVTIQDPTEDWYAYELEFLSNASETASFQPMIDQVIGTIVVTGQPTAVP